MEFTLHRQLKERYAGPDAPLEVRLGKYRIDAIADGQLIEVQVSSLGALRDKLRALLRDHRVRVVKPLFARKMIVRSPSGRRAETRRLSPKRCGWTSLFDELIYLTRLFPHPRLEIEVLLIDVEEQRRTRPMRRRRWRGPDYLIEDVRLLEVRESRLVATCDDLWKLLPDGLPQEFDTAELALACGIPRWRAQRVAYTLFHTGAALRVGHRGRGHLYRRVETRGKARDTARAIKPRRTTRRRAA